MKYDTTALVAFNKCESLIMAAHMELLTGLVLWRQRKSWKRAHVNYVCAPKDMRTLDCFSSTQSSPGTVFAAPFPWQESLGESLANSLSNIREHDCPSTTPNLNYMTISCPGSCVLTSKEVEALRSAEKKKKVKFGQTSCGIILFHWVMRPGFKYPKEVLVSRWSCLPGVETVSDLCVTLTHTMTTLPHPSLWTLVGEVMLSQFIAGGSQCGRQP